VTKEGAAIDTPDFPVPSAHAWKATAEVLAVGLGAMPPHAVWGALVGALFGMAVPLLRRFAPRTAPYLPSAMAFGIAFLVFPYMSFAFLYGAVAHAVWRKLRPVQADDLAFAVASGILVGFGVAQIGTAILEALGVPVWVALPR
jgi:hypothetical protein